MSFEKEVVFLGYRDMQLKDGTILHTVSMYVEGQALEVNVMDSNITVMSVVKSLSFGASATATFTLRKADKQYRLSLSALA